LTTPEPPVKDAVAYHSELAVLWEQRYKKPAFKARLRVVKKCLTGYDLCGKDWLDAGCGSGTLARCLADAGANVLGVDAAEEMITVARELSSHSVRREDLVSNGVAKCNQPMRKLRFEHIATIAQLPLPAESLDGILCSSVLEYVPDPAACLAEFARVLRPGGLLVISVANRNSIVRKAQVAMYRFGRLVGQRWCSFIEFSQNDYDAGGFCRLLQEHSFTTRKIIPFGSPIPQWLQRQEFGGSLLAFCAVREKLQKKVRK
jgi:2-polyprenyl-3-methyl-5-hydroxy-6-metoxy-1,4-benzoquinol methylase